MIVYRGLGRLKRSYTGDFVKVKGFTLIELLVVIAIIAIIAGILFPDFAQAKESGKKASCLSQSHQIGTAIQLYLSDNNGSYPQTKRSTSDPAKDDAAGGFEDPEYGTPFELILPYVNKKGQMVKGEGPAIYACPSDADPFGKICATTNPDAAPVTSYLMNGYFVFGLNESGVDQPTSTIMVAERRGQIGSSQPYCDTIYRPWWNPSNSLAPEDDMDAQLGAIAAQKHSKMAVYLFADGHSKALDFRQTYSPSGVNLHLTKQP